MLQGYVIYLKVPEDFYSRFSRKFLDINI